MAFDIGSLLQRLGPAVQGIAGNFMKQGSPFMQYAPQIAKGFGQSVGGARGSDIGSAIGNIIAGMQGKGVPQNASDWMGMAKPFLGALAPHAQAAGQALGSKIGGQQGGNIGSTLGNLFHGQFGAPGSAPYSATPGAAPGASPMGMPSPAASLPQAAPMGAPRPMIGPQMPFGPQMPPAAPNAAPRAFIGPAPPVPFQRPAAMMPGGTPAPRFGSVQDELASKFASGNPFLRDASQRQLPPRPQAPMNPHEALMNSLMKRNFADGGYVDGGDYNQDTYAHGGPVSLYEAMHHYAMGGHHGYGDMY